MSDFLYTKLEKLSKKSNNGNLKIVTLDGEEVVELCWEDIVDIEHSLKLAKEVQDKYITLTPKYAAIGLKGLDHFGENVPSVYKKFEFLLKYFVGSFEY